jgi:hypothetical protein
MVIRRFSLVLAGVLAAGMLAVPAHAAGVTVRRVDSWVRVTPDASGIVTIPYCPAANPCQFSAVPKVLVTARAPQGGGPPVPGSLVAYNATTTGFTLRAIATTGTVITTPIEVWYRAAVAGYAPAEEVGTATVTTNASGFATVAFTHQDRGVPKAVIASGVSPSGGTPSIPGKVVVSAHTATGFTVRVINPAGSAIANTAVTISYLASWTAGLDTPAGYITRDATVSVTTDASGFGTVTFAQPLPAAPSGLQAVGVAPASGTANIAGTVVAFSASTTGFRVRVINPAGTAIPNTVVTLSYHAVVGAREAGAVSGPAAPTSVTAAPGNTTAVVSWTRPADDGGAAITGYRITTAPGGLSMTVDDVTSAVVANLDNATAYTFTVTAINAVSDGTPSAPSSAVTPRPVAVPSAPVGVTAQPRDRGAVVSWQRPDSDGHLPLTGYTVTAAPGGSSVVVNGAVTSATVPNLSNGVPYTFTVTAANDKGTGPTGAASTPVTPGPTVPDPPAGVSADARGGGQIAVDWQPPVYTGGQPITGYAVTVTPGGQTIPLPASAASTVVTGLDSQTQYSFTVTASNSVGTSDRSVPTTPLSPAADLTPQARVLSDAALATLTGVSMTSATTATMTFTNAPPEVTGLQPGNVLLVGATPQAPYGGLRTVQQVTTSGATTTVTTGDAQLTDAFTALGFATSDRFDGQPPAGAARPNAAPDDGFTVTVDLGGELRPGVKIDGTLTLSGTARLDASIPPFPAPPTAAQIGIDAHLTFKLDATVTATSEQELKEEAVKNLKEIDITDKVVAGRIPISVALRLSTFLSGSVGTGFKAHASLGGSIDLTTPLWGGTFGATVSNVTHEISAPTAFANAKLEAGARAAIVGRVGVLKLKKDVIKATASMSIAPTIDVAGNPWFKVDACAKAGIEIGPFFGKFTVKNDHLLEICNPAAHADGPLAQLTITPRDARLPRGGTQQLTVSTAPYQWPGTLHPQWTVLGTDNGTVTSDGLYTAPDRVGAFEVAASLPGAGIFPAMLGKVTVRVGAPCAPQVTVGPLAPDGGHPRVQMTIAGNCDPVDGYVAVQVPHEFFGVCDGAWNPPNSGVWNLIDYPLGHPEISCNGLIPGRTYQFQVYGVNSAGPGDVTTTNPVTVTS